MINDQWYFAYIIYKILKFEDGTLLNCLVLKTEDLLTFQGLLQRFEAKMLLLVDTRKNSIIMNRTIHLSYMKKAGPVLRIL